jgi:hypothetical protein
MYIPKKKIDFYPFFIWRFSYSLFYPPKRRGKEGDFTTPPSSEEEEGVVSIETIRKNVKTPYFYYKTRNKIKFLY